MSTIYDISAATNWPWLILVGFALFSIASLACALAVPKIVVRIGGAWFCFCSAAIVAITVTQLNQALSLFHANHYVRLCGTLRNYKPLSLFEHGYETFEVSGHVFQTNWFDSKPGFNLDHRTGTPLQLGDNLCIDYLDDIIFQIRRIGAPGTSSIHSSPSYDVSAPIEVLAVFLGIAVIWASGYQFFGRYLVLYRLTDRSVQVVAMSFIAVSTEYDNITSVRIVPWTPRDMLKLFPLNAINRFFGELVCIERKRSRFSLQPETIYITPENAEQFVATVLAKMSIPSSR